MVATSKTAVQGLLAKVTEVQAPVDPKTQEVENLEMKDWTLWRLYWKAVDRKNTDCGRNGKSEQGTKVGSKGGWMDNEMQRRSWSKQRG